MSLDPKVCRVTETGSPRPKTQFGPRFVLVDFRLTSDAVGHIRLYDAGMPRALAHAAAKRDLVAVERPVDWEPPSIFRQLNEAELAAAEAELKALQRHAFEIVDPEIG